MSNPRYFLCATTIAAMIAFRVIYQFWPYWEGREGRLAAGWMIPTFVCIFIGILSAMTLGALLLNNLFLDPKPGQRSLRFLDPMAGQRFLWEALGLPALIAVAWCLSFGNMKGANRYFLDGFKTFVEEHPDFPAIKRWSCGLMLEDGAIQEKDWPKFVSDLSPSSVDKRTLAGNGEISLNFGGGFMHWGLIFHDKPGTPADSQDKIKLRIDDSSYVWVDNE